jgi:hypothetical protein
MMFDCICAKKVKNMRQAESFLFSDLAQYRFNPNREFFKVDDEIIKTSFDKIEGEYIDISTFNKNYIRESVKSEENHIDDYIDKIEFVCKRCGYETEHKHCMQNHYKRKIVCEAKYNDIDISDLLDILNYKTLNEKTHECEYCNRKFNSCSSKSRHKTICKKKPINEIILLKNTVEELVSKLDKQQDQILNLKQVSHTTNNNTQINLNGIKLKDFGNENMQAIPESLISSLFMNLRFRELLANLHCDPNYPENQNIRIKSIKRNTMEIFRNNKWDIMTFTNGLTELLLQGHKIFKDYYKNDKERILEEDMSEDELNEILNQLDKIEQLNKNEIKPLKEEIQLMLEEYKSTGSAIVLN